MHHGRRKHQIVTYKEEQQIDNRYNIDVKR